MAIGLTISYVGVSEAWAGLQQLFTGQDTRSAISIGLDSLTGDPAASERLVAGVSIAGTAGLGTITVTRQASTITTATEQADGPLLTMVRAKTKQKIANRPDNPFSQFQVQEDSLNRIVADAEKGFNAAGDAVIAKLEKLDDAAKASPGAVDIQKAIGGVPNSPTIIKNGHLAGKTHPVSGVPFDNNGYPIFDSMGEATLPGHLVGPQISDARQFQEATRQLWNEITDNPSLARRFTAEQLGQIERGEAYIDGFTWHHHQDGTTMQLVDRFIHSKTGHSGGRQATGGRP
jgi:hypothetical protein